MNRERINKQIRKKEAELLQVVAEIQEVEEFLDGIEDVEIKEIFELLYVDGKKQREVAKQFNIDRSYVSKKNQWIFATFTLFTKIVCYNYSREVGINFSIFPS